MKTIVTNRKLLRKTFELDKVNKLIKILTIINEFKNERILDPKEIIVLANVLALPKEYDKKRFSANTKKEIVDNIKRTINPRFSIHYMNNIMSSLRSKGFIYIEKDRVNYLSPKLDFLKNINEEFKMELIFK